MSHTSGPWKVFANRYTGNNYRLDGQSSIDETFDNARLIEAAPEMLEVLEDLDVIIGTALHNGHHDLIARVKAVIKRARGESRVPQSFR